MNRTLYGTIELDHLCVTGHVQLEIDELRRIWRNIQAHEDFLAVSFTHQPHWHAKTYLRETPLVLARRVYPSWATAGAYSVEKETPGKLEPSKEPESETPNQ